MADDSRLALSKKEKYVEDKFKFYHHVNILRKRKTTCYW